MVVTLNNDDYDVHHVLVDTGSLVDVLFYGALLKINISPEWSKMLDAPIIGFSGESIHVEGIIVLSVIVGRTLRRSQVLLLLL